MAIKTMSRTEHAGRIAVHTHDSERRSRPHKVVDMVVGGKYSETFHADPAEAVARYERIAAEIEATKPRTAPAFGAVVGSFGRRGAELAKSAFRPAPAPVAAPTAAYITLADISFMEFRGSGRVVEVWATAGDSEVRIVEGIPQDKIQAVRARMTALQQNGLLERVHYSPGALASVRSEMKSFVESFGAEADEPEPGPRF